MGNGNSERQANVEKKFEAVAMIYEPVTHTCRSGDVGNGEVTVARESRVRSAMIVATHQIRRQKRQGNSTEGTQKKKKKLAPARSRCISRLRRPAATYQRNLALAAINGL